MCQTIISAFENRKKNQNPSLPKEDFGALLWLVSQTFNIRRKINYIQFKTPKRN